MTYDIKKKIVIDGTTPGEIIDALCKQGAPTFVDLGERKQFYGVFDQAGPSQVYWAMSVGDSYVDRSTTLVPFTDEDFVRDFLQVVEDETSFEDLWRSYPTIDKLTK